MTLKDHKEFLAGLAAGAGGMGALIGLKYLYNYMSGKAEIVLNIVYVLVGLKILITAAVAHWLASALSKDYTIGICSFSAKHAALRRKTKDWLAQNQDNVSGWGDMRIRGLFCQ